MGMLKGMVRTCVMVHDAWWGLANFPPRVPLNILIEIVRIDPDVKLAAGCGQFHRLYTAKLQLGPPFSVLVGVGVGVW